MAAYSVTEVEVLDEDGGRQYAELANAAVAQYGGRFLVLAAEPTAVEGDWPAHRRIVIIEFPSMEQLRAWYDSPEYAPARAIARTALRRRLLFAEGVAVPIRGGNAEATVRRFYQAMSSGDTHVSDELLAPDWEDIPLAPGVSRGPEGYRQTVAFLRGAFPDLQVVVEELIVSGNRVAVRALARGTHRGAFLGIEATGRQVVFRAYDFHRLEAGRIAQSWHLEDNFELLTQLQGAVSSQDEHSG